MAEATKPISVTETPEFKEALASAVKKAADDAAMAATARAIAEMANERADIRAMAEQVVAQALAAARANSGTPAAPSDTSWVQALAMAIAQASHQGVGSKMRAIVPPDVIKARDDARKRMFDLLIAARGRGDVPTYRVTSKTLLDNALVEPFWIDSAHTAQPTVIDWPGVPNEVMVPVNECAREIYAAFEASIGVLISDDAQAVRASRKMFEDPRQGLVIKTSPGMKGGTRVSGNELPDDPSLLQGLRVRHDHEAGRYVEKNILGTIAAPARQSI